jgi:hypothetical protein
MQSESYRDSLRMRHGMLLAVASLSERLLGSVCIAVEIFCHSNSTLSTVTHLVLGRLNNMGLIYFSVSGDEAFQAIISEPTRVSICLASSRRASTRLSKFG